MTSPFYTPLLFAAAAAFVPADKLLMPTIGALAATFAPVLQAEGSLQTLTMPTIAALAATYAPTVQQASPQVLAPPAIAATAATYAPTVVDVGNDQTLEMPTIAALASATAPAVYISETDTSDPLWANVEFLGHFVGTDEQTTQTDVSVNGRTITMSNGAKIDDGVQLFGENTGLKDGTNDLVTAPNDANWWTASSLLCLQGWFYFPSAPATGLRFLMGKYRSVTNGRSLALYLTTDVTLDIANSNWKLVLFRQETSSAGTGFVSAEFTPAAETWYHFAASKDANEDWRLFAATYGDVVATMLAKKNYTPDITTNSQAFSIGTQNDGSTHQVGMRFREVRVTIGKGRYHNDAGFIVPYFKFAEAA